MSYSIIALQFGSEYGIRYFTFTPSYSTDTMAHWNAILNVTSSIIGIRDFFIYIIISIKNNFFTLNNFTDHVVRSDLASATFSLK